MPNVIDVLKRVIRRISRSIILNRYNNFTIAEYFRKQGAQIGEGCYIVPRNLGTEPYLVKIGNHVAITQGAQLHTHDGGTWIFRQEMPDIRLFGPIIIEDNCLIGMNAHILPNVRIGRNSIVAAGSVVISDVPENSIVIGVPARRMGSVDKYREKCLELWAVQKPPNYSTEGAKHYETARNLDNMLIQLKLHLLKVFEAELRD